MKALFIWRKDFEKNIDKKIISQFKDYQLLTSQDEYQSFLEKNDLLSYSKIYILAELDWNKDKLFEGYEIGFQIIENWKDKEAPHIEFFSIASQNIIFNHVSDKLKFIVKAFPFTDLLDIDKKFKFNTENINQFKWNYFLYLILSNYGIIDNFLHRLESIKVSDSNFQTKLNDFVLEISSYGDFIGESIIQHISKVAYNSEFISKVKTLLEERLEEIKGKTISKIEFPISLRILVVDDNKNDLELIEKSLKRYKNQILITTSGDKALKSIKNDECDFIITDLELLDENGFYQKVQGVELFDVVIKSDKKVIGVITGLGRKGIAKLLHIDQKLVLPKKHLLRFDIDEELDNLLKNLLDAYHLKENRLQIEFGPEKGIFKKTGFKNALSEAFVDIEFKDATWKFAFDIFKKFKNKELSNSNWNKKIIKNESLNKTNYHEFILEKLKTLLAHRLIVLYLASRNNFEISSEADEEYKEMLESNNIFINKNYINTICLHYSENKQDGLWIIEKKHLFPEEINFLKDIYAENANFLIKDNAPITYNWLKIYFDFEEEWYKLFEVSDNIDEWNYDDLYKVLEYMSNDFNVKYNESYYAKTLSSIIDNLTRSIENEIFPAMPGLKTLLNQIGDKFSEID